MWSPMLFEIGTCACGHCNSTKYHLMSLAVDTESLRSNGGCLYVSLALRKSTYRK